VLQEKKSQKGDTSRKNDAPVSSGQFSRQSRLFDLDSDPLQVTFKSGRGKGQPHLLDSVDSVAWHVRSIRV